MKNRLIHDPYNVIITGVGGQGNVLMAQMFGAALADQGFNVTVGDTYGAAQRGGAVLSHLRISEKSVFSPLTPAGRADFIISLEPAEALRVIGLYGNPDVNLISNNRPNYPFDVTSGNVRYPNQKEIETAAAQLTKKAIFVDASALALKMGAPVLTNTIMSGMAVGSGLLPVSPENFEAVISDQFAGKKFELNQAAFRKGLALAEDHWRPATSR